MKLARRLSVVEPSPTLAVSAKAAKLKADLNSQAAKTKKLEKDVQSMREEMRKQQLRRLNNQVPDKP